MADTHTPLIAKTLGPGPSRAPDVAIGLAEAGYEPSFTILGPTDLRTGVSRTKFDAEADFEVNLPPALPKPRKNIEKLREICDKKTFNSFF